MDKQVVLEGAYQGAFNDELQKIAADPLKKKRLTRGGRLAEATLGTAGGLTGLAALARLSETGIGKSYSKMLSKLRGKGGLGTMAAAFGSVIPFTTALALGARAPIVAGRALFPRGEKININREKAREIAKALVGAPSKLD